MKEKIYLMRIIKRLSLGALVFLMVLKFTGNRVSHAPMQKVQKETLKYVDAAKMQEGTPQMIKRLYGLNPKDFEGICLMYPKTNMGAEEVLIVKIRDVNGQQDKVKEAVEKRLETQKKNFDGYGTYQYGMLKQSRIVVKGNYILFISGKNPGKVEEAFLKAL